MAGATTYTSRSQEKLKKDCTFCRLLYRSPCKTFGKDFTYPPKVFVCLISIAGGGRSGNFGQYNFIITLYQDILPLASFYPFHFSWISHSRGYQGILFVSMKKRLFSDSRQISFHLDLAAWLIYLPTKRDRL